MKADDIGHHPSTKNTKYKDKYKDRDKYKYKDKYKDRDKYKYKDKVKIGPNMCYFFKKDAKYDILIIMINKKNKTNTKTKTQTKTNTLKKTNAK